MGRFSYRHDRSFPDRIDKSRLKSIDNEPKVTQLQSDNNINPLIYDLFYQYNIQLQRFTHRTIVMKLSAINALP